jgi:DNA-binding response OmpR family regulator
VQAGMRGLRDSALEWLARGETTLVEVERVIGQVLDYEEQDEHRGPPRILVVDDEEEARVMMEALLRQEGFEVRAVEDGEQAIDVLKGDPYWSLMILDLLMPRKDGREVLQWVRGSVETAALPVLVRTGKEGEESEAELLEAGADDYVPKGVHPHRFLARVRAVIRRAAL